MENTAWLGSGKVFFPTMPQTISFGSELRFQRPATKTKSYWLMTSLESWKEGMRGELGMHFESGFLRAGADGDTVEWSIAHNFGVAESSVGTLTDGSRGGPAEESNLLRVVFESQSLGNASNVTHVRRDMMLTLDKHSGAPVSMLEQFYMSTQTVPEVTHHMTIEYVPLRLSDTPGV
jgi:hypothetical protein